MKKIIQISEEDYNKCIYYLSQAEGPMVSASGCCRMVRLILEREDEDEEEDN